MSQITLRRPITDALPREVTGLTDSHQHVLALLRETVRGDGRNRRAAGGKTAIGELTA